METPNPDRLRPCVHIPMITSDLYIRYNITGTITIHKSEHKSSIIVLITICKTSENIHSFSKNLI